MKKIVSLLLALTLLCGCAAQTQTETQAVTETEATAETAEQIAIPTTPDVLEDMRSFTIPYMPEAGLNPYECGLTLNRGLLSLLYEPLFVVNHNFEAEPVLCESFSVSTDGLVYTFNLKPDVVFWDGTPMTAADVVASIQAARMSRFYKIRLQNMLSCTAVDNLSVRVQLMTSYENFALMMDVPIVKQNTVERNIPVGSGPYAYSGEKLARNAAWWNPDPPPVDVDEIGLFTCNDYYTLRDAFQYGDVDIVCCDPNSPACTGYRCDFEIWEVPTTIMVYLGFNYEAGYFANDTLRRAVTYAVDRESIVSECYNGFAYPSVLPCSPNSDLYDATLAKDYEFNISQVAKAVSDSGVKNNPEYAEHTGYLLVCNDEPGRETAANIIAKVLNDAGLNIKVRACDSASFNMYLGTGDYDFYLSETRMTANFDLSQFFLEYGALQFASSKNENLASLCASAFANSGNYYDLCRQVMQNGAICAVCFKNYAAYVMRGKLAALEPAVDCVFHLENTGRTLADADKTFEVREAEKAAAESEAAAQQAAQEEEWSEDWDEDWDD